MTRKALGFQLVLDVIDFSTFIFQGRQRGLLFDSAIVAHGFAKHLRDYDLTVGHDLRNASGRRLEGRDRFRSTRSP
jgi:hypothetical protein